MGEGGGDGDRDGGSDGEGEGAGDGAGMGDASRESTTAHGDREASSGVVSRPCVKYGRSS